jgi:hypothetical protein
MQELAQQLAFEKILVATGAHDSAIIKVLMELKDKMR